MSGGIGKTIRGIFDWKTWTIIGLGGTTVVFGTALVSQWDHASLGRQVSRNVKRFLVDTGSQISNGVVTGGRLSAPMKVNTAVNALIVQMLNEAFDDIQQRGGVVSSGGGSVGHGGLPPHDDDIEYPTYSSVPPPVGKRPKQQQQQVAQVSAPIVSASARMAAERKKKRTSARCMEVSKMMVDDGGYGASPGGRSGGKRSKSSFDYNPNEFSPRGRQGGTCPRKSVFTDDEGGDDGEEEGGEDDAEYE